MLGERQAGVEGVNDRSCLVTGGAGFIGSHLVTALVAQGYRVRVFDDLSSGHEEYLREVADDVEFIRGDIRDLDALRSASKGVDTLFHHAAISSAPRSLQDPVGTLDINVRGAQNALEAARLTGVRRVVIASSAAVYGAATEMPLRESMLPRPISPYGAHKLMCEHLCSVYSHVFDLEAVALRYFNVYGPRQDPNSDYAGVITRFAARLRAGEAPVIFGDGEQTRDYVYVGDVVRANLLAAASEAAVGSVFNIGSGERTSLNTLLRVMGEVMNVPVAPERTPARTGDIRHSVASITRAGELLGYAPQVTLREGLASLLERRGDDEDDQTLPREISA